MKVESNNRKVLLSKQHYNELIEEIKKSGDEVVNTLEVCGATCFTSSTTKEIKEMFGISDEFESEFMNAISTFEKKSIGPYITEKYFHILPGIKEAFKHMFHDCYKTRRFVVDFPEDHCFRSVQFLFRDNTINVVCFMRSCDAIKNLPYDMWLCSVMADIVSHYIERYTDRRPYDYHFIKMMFGSLHVYKEDIK